VLPPAHGATKAWNCSASPPPTPSRWNFLDVGSAGFSPSPNAEEIPEPTGFHVPAKPRQILEIQGEDSNLFAGLPLFELA